MISLIVAVAENGVIGDRNALLWHISEDLRHFYLTRVFRAYEGDTRFPAWDEREWRLVSSESFSGGKDYPWPFAFELYERR